MPTKFSDTPGAAERALQAWIILVGMAMRRETTTYKLLARKMFGREASGVLANILGCILFFCQQNELPLLTSLVGNSETGRPGEGIGCDDPDAKRERAFGEDWYAYYPPTVQQLEHAWERGMAAAR